MRCQERCHVPKVVIEYRQKKTKELSSLFVQEGFCILKVVLGLIFKNDNKDRIP